MSNDRQSLNRRAGLLRLREQPRRHTPLYRIWLDKTFRKLLAGGVILFVISFAIYTWNWWDPIITKYVIGIPIFRS